MSWFKWLVPQKSRSFAASSHGRHRRASGQGGAQASRRQHRRNQRRELLYVLVRESMIRAGVLSTSYQFKALTLDAEGDGFLVLIDLARPDLALPDAQRMQTEHWLQQQAQRRHAMEVRAVYWRLRPAAPSAAALPPSPANTASVQAAPTGTRADEMSAWAGLQAALPAASSERVQPVAADEVLALQQALRQATRSRAPATAGQASVGQRPSHKPNGAAPPPPGLAADLVESDATSAFSPLGPTQYGKL